MTETDTLPLSGRRRLAQQQQWPLEGRPEVSAFPRLRRHAVLKGLTYLAQISDSIQRGKPRHYNDHSIRKSIHKSKHLLHPSILIKAQPKMLIFILKSQLIPASPLVLFHQINPPDGRPRSRPWSAACPRSPLLNADSNKSSSLPPPTIPRSPVMSSITEM